MESTAATNIQVCRSDWPITHREDVRLERQSGTDVPASYRPPSLMFKLCFQRSPKAMAIQTTARTPKTSLNHRIRERINRSDRWSSWWS